MDVDGRELGGGGGFRCCCCCCCCCDGGGGGGGDVDGDSFAITSDIGSGGGCFRLLIAAIAGIKAGSSL